MLDYAQFFSQKVQDLRNEHRYRVFADLERFANKPPFALWRSSPICGNHIEPKEVSIWCSNDYLGLSHHPDVIIAQQQATQTYGAGSGGTRNISGTAHLHIQLEEKIAKLHQKEKGLIFTSGYTANEATLSTLGKHIPNVVFLTDEKIHASMIEGVLHSKAQKVIFRHNDMKDLNEKLKLLPIDQPKIIVVVSVYSMDGDFVPLEDIIELAKKYKALIYLDEVHGVGVYGPAGAGVAASKGLEQHIDIIQGNFAKGFGIFGGYITGSNSFVDFIRGYASGFIFTTSLPPCVAAAAIESLHVLEKDPSLQEGYAQKINYLKNKIKESIVPFKDYGSHIIPIVVGDPYKCRVLSQRLLAEYNMYVQPINYPTVPRGSERLRVTITPYHTEQMMDDFINALSALWKELALSFK